MATKAAVAIGVLAQVANAVPRLTVVNGCGSEPIWIASSSGIAGGPSLRLEPGQRHTYDIPDGTASTRFWPKAGCDSSGQSCKIGNSGGPGQVCGSEACSPPVDSKFEATFGNRNGNCHTDASQCDWWDTSGVDGFTLPYKVEVSEECKRDGYKGSDIDCSRLSLSQCPSDYIEGLGNVDLKLHYPQTDELVGCYSPCSVLTSSQWNNPNGRYSPPDGVAGPYCCPTPPISSEQCRAGPAARSQYSKLIHASCPGVYSFAYDDAVGLQVCPATTTYVWTLYCPNGGGGPSPPAPPAPPSPWPPAPSSWEPCSTGPCCAPNTNPAQFCPGHIPCGNCGAPGCQCPRADVELNATVVV